jgi:hypothetical protein
MKEKTYGSSAVVGGPGQTSAVPTPKPTIFLLLLFLFWGTEGMQTK